MADIDQILAGGSSAGSRYDFSTFGDPVKSFFDANKQRAEFDLRRAFKDGVPVDANGQPDFAAMANTLFKKGDLGQGVAVSNLDLQRQQLRYGQQQSADIANVEGGGQPAARPPIVSPPSANRSASVPVAPAIGQGKDTPSAQPARGATVAQVLEAQGIPNDQLGAASASVARQLGLSDPNAPIDINDPQVRNVLVPAVQQLKRMGIGQPAQPGQPAVQNIPPVQPQPQVAQAQPAPVVAQGTGQPAPVTDRLTTAGPADPSRADKLIAYYSGIMSNPMSPKQNVELAKVRLKALQENAALTPTQKEYSQAVLQGFKGTLQDWQERTDDQNTQREILKSSIIPKLDKSQETATAARDDIQAIHRAREQLDSPGGIFSGAAADVRLKVAKVAEFLGVPNADKIANTEAFGAAIGSRVLTLVKGLGAGTGISNADRDFAAAMAGGNIKLDEASIRRIMDIGEKAARSKIDQHNGLTDRTLKANEALRGYKDVYRVEAPGAYKKTAAPAADPYEKARAAIAAGAPRDAVAARLKQSGFDPGRL